MRNKVEIRAFAVEQVVKMRCMSDCTIEDVVEQAKLVEGYVVGEAQLSEDGDSITDMMKLASVIGNGFQCTKVNDLKPNEA